MRLKYGDTGLVSHAEFDHIVSYCEGASALFRCAFGLAVGTFVRYDKGDTHWFDEFRPSGNDIVTDWYSVMVCLAAGAEARKLSKYQHPGTIRAVRREMLLCLRKVLDEVYRQHVRYCRQYAIPEHPYESFRGEAHRLLNISLREIVRHQGYEDALHQVAGLLMSNISDDGFVSVVVDMALQEALIKGGPFDRILRSDEFNQLFLGLT